MSFADKILDMMRLNDDEDDYEFDNEEYFDAVDWFTKAIERDPKLTDAYNERGLAFAKKEKYKEAIDDYMLVILRIKICMSITQC